MKSIKHDQAKVFDSIAREYRDIHTENLKISGADSDYFAEYKIQEISNKFNFNINLKVADLGCGDGLSAVFFGKYFNRLEYYGYDISLKSIDIARSRNLNNFTFSHYDGKNVPSVDNTFDMVFISCVLHHIDFKEHHIFLRESLRILKPGGTLVIFEHNPMNPLTRKIVKDCVFDKDAVLISAIKLRDILDKAGFNKIKCFYTIFMPRTNFFRKLMFLEKYLKWLPLGGQYYLLAKK